MDKSNFTFSHMCRDRLFVGNNIMIKMYIWHIFMAMEIRWWRISEIRLGLVNLHTLLYCYSSVTDKGYVYCSHKLSASVFRLHFVCMVLSIIFIKKIECWSEQGGCAIFTTQPTPNCNLFFFLLSRFGIANMYKWIMIVAMHHSMALL